MEAITGLSARNLTQSKRYLLPIEHKTTKALVYAFQRRYMGTAKIS